MPLTAVGVTVVTLTCGYRVSTLLRISGSPARTALASRNAQQPIKMAFSIAMRFAFVRNALTTGYLVAPVEEDVKSNLEVAIRGCAKELHPLCFHTGEHDRRTVGARHSVAP